MNRDDIIRMAQEAGFVVDEISQQHQPNCIQHTWYLIDEALERFAALVAAEKDKEIELLRADAKRLDWCISVLYRQNGKDSYLVFDTGCGCCSDAKRFDCSISGRDAIDDAIRARGEQEQPR